MKALIMACLDQETSQYLQVAGKLYMADLYKRVFNSDTPLHLKDHIKKLQDLNYYRDWNYSSEELDKINSFLQHDQDFTFTYTRIKQFEAKYLLKDSVSGKVYETPQFLFARIAMTIFEEKPNRLYHIERYINKQLLAKRLSLPSPNWEYIGTKKSMATSCCLFTSEDTGQSIAAGNHIADIMNMASAGLGTNMQIRSLGDGVRNNRITHLGKLPYLKAIQSLSKSNKQRKPRWGSNMLHTFL
jgi:ribonucleoside-diphosphate reductase alpha chain